MLDAPPRSPSGSWRAARAPVRWTQRMRLAVLILPALVALASPALAQVYEYTTPDGVTHYSNVPPGRRDGVRVTQPSPRPPQPRLQQPSTDSLRFLQYDAHIREAAALYRLPESFL